MDHVGETGHQRIFLVGHFLIGRLQTGASLVGSSPGDLIGLERTLDEMRVLLVACKRSLVEDHYGLLSGLGLQPEIIDVDAFALGNAWEFMNLTADNFGDEDKVVALVDIGANKTNINIVRGSTSYFTREIYLGGDDFTGGISKKLAIDINEAESLKRDPGDQVEETKEEAA